MLVKWTQLGYDQCTWEVHLSDAGSLCLADTHTAKLIVMYVERALPLQVGCR